MISASSKLFLGSRVNQVNIFLLNKTSSITKLTSMCSLLLITGFLAKLMDGLLSQNTLLVMHLHRLFSKLSRISLIYSYTHLVKIYDIICSYFEEHSKLQCSLRCILVVSLPLRDVLPWEKP